MRPIVYALVAVALALATVYVSEGGDVVYYSTLGSTGPSTVSDSGCGRRRPPGPS